MIGIYKITNSEGKIYIGCTISWDRRLKEYQNLKVKGQSKNIW
jgi:predicted GIY-YIG superfamily endonuclease